MTFDLRPFCTCVTPGLVDLMKVPDGHGTNCNVRKIHTLLTKVRKEALETAAKHLEDETEYRSARLLRKLAETQT